VAGRGEFTINVAMIEGGRPVLGIVYAPALGKLYAALGAGCAVTADVAVDSPARRIAELSPRPIAAREPRPDALVAVVSRSHGTEATNAYLARFRLAGSRSAGSSLKFCLIAEGGADVYPRHGTTSEWDTAAGHAVLEAAGGSVLTLDGAPLRYGKAAAGFLNPHFVAWGRRVVEPGADAAASGA
jgi:3'(2'), 5'-bisphosphate nucleotidase